MTEVIQLAPFMLHATLWAPLEAQSPDGPVLLCRDCLMAWRIVLPESDQSGWQDSLDEIKEHAEAHEGGPIQ